MTALLVSHLFAVLLGAVLYRWLGSRRRFNAGVAAGRRAERLEHGWRDDPALSVPLPRRRRWRQLDRRVPDRVPRVLDDMPRHR